MELEPIDPETAFELYIAEKETSVADATVASHKSRLSFLLRWCAERDIENLNELTGRRLQEFQLWRRNVGDLTKVSEKTQMDTLRVFVKWLESVDAVEQDLHKKVRSPDITPRENSRDVMLETEDAETMLAYLERYEYASIHHVTATLLWHTMLRMGSVRALDVDNGRGVPILQSLVLDHFLLHDGATFWVDANGLARLEGNWICSYGNLPATFEDVYVLNRDEKGFINAGRAGQRRMRKSGS